MKNYFKKFSVMFLMSLILVLGSSISVFAADSTYTENLIPTMTSNTAPSGVVTSSSYSADWGRPSYAAFDHTSLYWMASSASVPQWISYKFPEQKKICKYTMTYITYTDLTRAPKDWKFQGSNDGQTWTDLDSQSNMSFSSGEKKVFTFNNTMGYSYYRIYITAINGVGFGATIDEIEMMEKLPIEATSILLNKTSTSLNINDSQQLIATTTPAGAQVTWTSDNTGVATVDSNGNVTGVSTGTCTITAKTSDGLTATCTVTVTKKAEESISLNKSTTDLTTGDSETLTATTTPSAVNVTWNSSNTSVATVDSNGKVTAVGAGTAIITATTTDGSNLSASCTVNVTASNGETTTPTDGTSTIVNIAHAKGDNTNNAGGGVSIIFNGTPDTTLSVVKTADVKSVWVGDTFNYTIVVTNTGTKTAKAVVINDSAPSHIQFIPSEITTTQGTVDSSSTASNIIVNVGDILPSGTVTIKVPVNVVL